MKIMSGTLRRVAGPALVAGLVVTAFATPATAAPTPGSTVVRLGGSVALTARSGVANDVAADNVSGRLIMRDATGIAAGPGCTQTSFSSADCGPAGSVGLMAIAVGDQNDRVANNTGIRASIDAGTGNDTVKGGSGNDTINVHDGVGGDTVTCDGGFDVVSADRGDNVAPDCEVRGVY